MQTSNAHDMESEVTPDANASSKQPVTSTTPESSSRVPVQEADPLELHKLSLSYDYLMFKIKDYIKTLTDQTYESVLQKQDHINHDYFENQLNLPIQYEEIDKLLKTCNELEQEFMKIDQLEMFAHDFKQRLDAIEKGFGKKS
ncbi:hypothetical protein CORT_0B09600 [Candida orthopsilosis Co 90-125]|uniref:Biogenesis of lysosome-related organelles complex 1 subunit CNL1 n=1 Tax=Candida orthopsilosis (strain 90-125) TaxID=1136231 RepID=H8X0F2_CANO9|nr:hypothetical protein CORT_0B09600 [Candida orthopsilosis Co 90-125]CCG22664.1 hypothetical protein CORT_0B09600 [Candida orthopsilosis Co 90-125]